MDHQCRQFSLLYSIVAERGRNQIELVMPLVKAHEMLDSRS
jgi:hypothetical protein